MTITVNSDCTSIQFESTLIDAYVLDPTIELSITFTNCDGTDYNYDITASEVTSGTPNYVTITPDLIISDSATEFSDGVYTVTLTSDDNGSVQTEVQCMLVDCNLECQVFDFQSENLTSNIFMYYQALLLGETCDNCNCSGMCALYNKILNILDSTDSTNDCGCN